mmetsp:Transcript_3176/g.12762  ORF Transcript_3176/g.12762 Transcript_3176/m.12762 type:complete len:230 (-) Transcript_3176:82-771(-)
MAEHAQLFIPRFHSRRLPFRPLPFHPPLVLQEMSRRLWQVEPRLIERITGDRRRNQVWQQVREAAKNARQSERLPRRHAPQRRAQDQTERPRARDETHGPGLEILAAELRNDGLGRASDAVAQPDEEAGDQRHGERGADAEEHGQHCNAGTSDENHGFPAVAIGVNPPEEAADGPAGHEGSPHEARVVARLVHIIRGANVHHHIAHIGEQARQAEGMGEHGHGRHQQLT